MEYSESDYYAVGYSIGTGFSARWWILIGLLMCAPSVLKLTGVLDWSWWLASAPFLGVVAVMVGALLVLGVAIAAGKLQGGVK